MKRLSVRRTFLTTALLTLSILILTAQPPTYAFVTGQAASLVLGQSSWTTNTYATSQTGLKGPTGLGFDSKSRA